MLAGLQPLIRVVPRLLALAAGSLPSRVVQPMVSAHLNLRDANALLASVFADTPRRSLHLT